MANDWILRIGNGKNFINSSKYNIWGISSKYKTFISSSEPGDRLWFVLSGSNGKIIAVSEFYSLKERETGPLISLTLTNEELGWDISGEICDIQIEYKNLINLSECDLHLNIKGQTTIRLYKEDSYEIDLPLEYMYIKKYLNTKISM
jgi:hypothetical protein